MREVGWRSGEVREMGGGGGGGGGVIGVGEGPLLEMGPFPLPKPHPHPPKTFDWWGGGASGVPLHGVG